MKRAFTKTGFVVSVLLLDLLLLFPAMAAFGALFPPRRGPDGLYRGGDLTGLSVVAVFICTWVADRIVAYLFRTARIAGDRWSLFRSPRTWGFP